MSQILDSMSQSAVVSYPQVLQQLSTESSEEAKDSQVNAILSQGLKQVLSALLLISFATQLLLKEGITTSKHESSWDTVVILFGNSEFIITIHSVPNWKIDVWKTGGLSYFSPASTSPDMTQSADNINLITSRHSSTTVIHFNDVVHIAADMQTQSTVRDDKVQANASQHNTIVINDTINDENSKNSPTLDVSKQLCGIQPRLRDIVTCNGFHEEACWYSVHDGTYYFVQPRTCNYVNQCAAQFPEGIITNYEEGKIICLDKMECSHMVSQHIQAGYMMYVTSRNSVYDNPEKESYAHWHLSSYFDFMTDKRMTFDEFIAEQGMLSFELKKPVSTMIIVDQCGWADNMMCKINQTSQDFLLDQFKNYPEAVKTIKRNSIGTRPSSSQEIQLCPSLTPDRTTNYNNNVLKAGIIQKMPSIQSNFSNDKIKSNVMRVAVSVQECVKIDHASNELRSSPSNFISKIDKLTHCDYIAGHLSIDGMEELGNGLENHKMCIESVKTLLSSSKYYRQGPDGLTTIGNIVKDVVFGTSPATFSKDTSASMVYEV